MFEISWSEVAVIMVIALVVVGPKELPGLLRQLGRMIGQFKRMASDFHTQFNDAVKEAELDGLKKEVEELRNTARNTFNFEEGRIPDTAPTPVEPDTPVASELPAPQQQGDAPQVSRKTKAVVLDGAEGVVAAKKPAPRVRKPKTDAAETAKPRAAKKPAATKSRAKTAVNDAAAKGDA